MANAFLPCLFGPERVRVLLTALVLFSLRPEGFRNRQPRPLLALLLGIPGSKIAPGRMSYDITSTKKWLLENLICLLRVFIFEDYRGEAASSHCPHCSTHNSQCECTAGFRRRTPAAGLVLQAMNFITSEVS